ncbi:hypothetical protein M569_17498 [Genlisea aurea]|uniref:Uncharacterized protein n=1 Tax=Genlisea aurea TaxID=192259 RepID=S8BRS8_9LAMI|nr:hypothetical protein M569_17498 [Genlisea aurea]
MAQRVFHSRLQYLIMPIDSQCGGERGYWENDVTGIIMNITCTDPSILLVVAHRQLVLIVMNTFEASTPAETFFPRRGVDKWFYSSTGSLCAPPSTYSGPHSKFLVFCAVLVLGGDLRTSGGLNASVSGPL